MKPGIGFDKSSAYASFITRTPNAMQRGKLYAADVAAGEIDISDDGGGEGKQGLASSTFNLVKACVGSGVLALSAGVSAIGDVPSA